MLPDRLPVGRHTLTGGSRGRPYRVGWVQGSQQQVANAKIVISTRP